LNRSANAIRKTKTGNNASFNILSLYLKECQQFWHIGISFGLGFQDIGFPLGKSNKKTLLEHRIGALLSG
jgi:hypothetical protein